MSHDLDSISYALKRVASALEAANGDKSARRTRILRVINSFIGIGALCTIRLSNGEVTGRITDCSEGLVCLTKEDGGDAYVAVDAIQSLENAR